MDFKVFYTICSKCSAKKFTNKNAITPRQEKFGGTFEGNVLTTEKEWLCRECKNAVKDATEEKKEE